MNTQDSLSEKIARKPWLLIIAGFLLLISIWTFFFIVALRNQPVRLPLSGTPVPEEVAERPGDATVGATGHRAAPASAESRGFALFRHA